MLKFLWSLPVLAWALFLPLPEGPEVLLLIFSFDVDVLGALDNPAAALAFNGPDGLPWLLH